jgi:hypothetical protein
MGQFQAPVKICRLARAEEKQNIHQGVRKNRTFTKESAYKNRTFTKERRGG